MRDIQAIRHQNLQFLVEESAAALGQERGAVAHIATQCGIPPSLLSMLIRRVAHSTTGRAHLVGDDTATKLESGMGKDPGWMDVDRSQARDYKEAALLDRIRKLTPGKLTALERVLEALSEPDDSPADVDPTVQRAAASDPRPSVP